jgi:O-antigen/teichoic acid export membrane protein
MLPKEEILLRSVKNSAASLVGSIAALLVSLFIAGYSIRILGEGLAGFIMLTQSILGFSAGIFNFGLGGAVVKEVSAASATNDKRRIADTISSTSFINILIGIFVTIVFILVSQYVVQWSKLPSEHFADAETSIIFYALAFLINFGINSYQAIPSALQRYDYANIYTSFQAITNGVVQITILVTVPSLTNLSLGSFGVAILQTVFLFVLLKKLVSEFYYPHWNFQTLRRLSKFSSFVFLTQGGYVLRDYVDRTILTTLKGVVALPGFLIGQSVLGRIRSFISGPVHFVFPLMSSASESFEAERLFSLYDKIHWFVSVVGALVFGILSVFGYWILSIWIGKSFADSYTYLFQIACFQGMWGTFSVIPHFVSYGLNKPANNLLEAVFTGCLVAVLAFVMIPVLGVLGAALAQLTAYVSTIILVHWNLRRTIFRGFSLAKVFDPLISPFILGTVCFLFSLYTRALTSFQDFNLRNCVLMISPVIILSILVIMYEQRVNVKLARIETLLDAVKLVKGVITSKLAST